MSDERFVSLKGEQFKVRNGIALMALMRFAHIAQAGTDSGEMEGLAAMYDLLESAIADEDWGRFQAHAVKARATDKDLMMLVRKVIRGEADRPTQRPSDSSDGPPRTRALSAVDSSSQVIARLEGQGRPDLANMARMASAASA